MESTLTKQFEGPQGGRTFSFAPASASHLQLTPPLHFWMLLRALASLPGQPLAPIPAGFHGVTTGQSPRPAVSLCMLWTCFEDPQKGFICQLVLMQTATQVFSALNSWWQSLAVARG